MSSQTSRGLVFPLKNKARTHEDGVQSKGPHIKIHSYYENAIFYCLIIFILATLYYEALKLIKMELILVVE